jgi:hypothetical protein
VARKWKRRKEKGRREEGRVTELYCCEFTIFWLEFHYFSDLLTDIYIRVDEEEEE